MHYHEVAMFYLTAALHTVGRFGCSRTHQTSTSILMLTHAATDDFTSKPWTPEKILEEFEKDGFLQMMDQLNKAMEFVPVVQ